MNKCTVITFVVLVATMSLISSFANADTEPAVLKGQVVSYDTSEGLIFSDGTRAQLWGLTIVNSASVEEILKDAFLNCIVVTYEADTNTREADCKFQEASLPEALVEPDLYVLLPELGVAIQQCSNGEHERYKFYGNVWASYECTNVGQSIRIKLRSGSLY
jgi:hypothetical protein